MTRKMPTWDAEIVAVRDGKTFFRFLDKMKSWDRPFDGIIQGTDHGEIGHYMQIRAGGPTGWERVGPVREKLDEPVATVVDRCCAHFSRAGWCSTDALRDLLTEFFEKEEARKRLRLVYTYDDMTEDGEEVTVTKVVTLTGLDLDCHIHVTEGGWLYVGDQQVIYLKKPGEYLFPDGEGEICELKIDIKDD